VKLVQVLGPGCPKCGKLLEAVQAAVKELGIEAMVEKVTDMDVITGFRVMATPALVVDGEVKIAGRIPSADELKRVLI
jgi:small redox-active disulfide protein 2